MNPILCLAIGAGIVLIADILRLRLKMRRERLDARRTSTLQFRLVDAHNRVSAQRHAISAVMDALTDKPRGMNAEEVRRFNRGRAL